MGSSYPGLFVTASPDESGRSIKTYPQLRATVGSRERPANGGDRAYMEVRREQAKISDYCGFESRLPRLEIRNVFVTL